MYEINNIHHHLNDLQANQEQGSSDLKQLHRLHPTPHLDTLTISTQATTSDLEDENTIGPPLGTTVPKPRGNGERK